MDPKPSLCRSVIFSSVTGAKHAAVIVETDNESLTVGLCVFNPLPVHVPAAPFDADGKAGTWCWPPRDPPKKKAAAAADGS